MSERTRVPSNTDEAEEGDVRDAASTYPTDRHGCILCPLCPIPKDAAELREALNG